MRVASVFLRGERSATECAYAAPGLGFGVESPKKGGRELSLMASETLDDVRGVGGLCSRKFNADITTEGLCYAALHVGDRLRLGGAEVEISALGKRCFDECPVRMRGGRCPLPQSCAFARVLFGGEIRTGDLIEPLAPNGEQRHE